MAALMPPAAATECERTGWTLDRIATVAPASAAARAARWPARPAPMMRTSCSGIEAPSGGPDWTLYVRPSRTRMRLPGRKRRGDGAPHLLERHDAGQDPVAVDGHERAERAQALGPEQRLDWLLGRHAPLRGIVGDHVAHRALGGAAGHRLRDVLLAGEPEEVAALVDDGEPVPAVAQEVLLLGPARGDGALHGDGRRIHDIGHRDPLQALGERRARDGAARGRGDEPADERPPQPADAFAVDRA